MPSAEDASARKNAVLKSATDSFKQWLNRKLDEDVSGRKGAQTRYAAVIGVTQATISRWATGANLPSFEQIVMLAELTGESVDVILGLRKQPSHETEEDRALLVFAALPDATKHRLYSTLHRVYSAPAGAELSRAKDLLAPTIPPPAEPSSSHSVTDTGHGADTKRRAPKRPRR